MCSGIARTSPGKHPPKAGGCDKPIGRRRVFQQLTFAFAVATSLLQTALGQKKFRSGERRSNRAPAQTAALWNWRRRWSTRAGLVPGFDATRIDQRHWFRTEVVAPAIREPEIGRAS